MISLPRRPTPRYVRILVTVLLAAASSACQLPTWLLPAAPTPTPPPATTTPGPPGPAPTTSTPATTSAPPTTSHPAIPDPPRAAWCSTGTLPGPTSAPPGSTVVAPGSDIAAIASAHPAGTTYWFEPGTHSPNAAIEAQTGDVFVGAPGAVLDGGFRGIPAFIGGGSDVRIQSLTIQRFGTVDGRSWVNAAAVNRSVAPRWTVVDNTIRQNDGNALFLGDGSVTRRNCFADNGQTGLAAPAQTRNGSPISLGGIVVADNEIRGNNRNDLESAPGACRGCTGGMKLWQTTGASVTGNTVSGNHGVGIWLDNNNVDATVSGNLVDGNDREGIMVETSYNSRVVDNEVTANAIVAGRLRSDPFPVAGIFVSNSGASGRVAGTPGIEIARNRVADNWNGVVVFWDADRYCGSAADTSVGQCTLGGATLARCADAVERPPSLGALVEECHWRTTGVEVHDNEFSISPSLIASCSGKCGRNGLVASTAPTTTRVRLADGTIRPVTNPLTTDWAQGLVADPTTNRFFDNRYQGSWTFALRTAGPSVGLASWNAAGHDTRAP